MRIHRHVTEFILKEVHLVLRILVICASFQITPLELAFSEDIGEPAVISGHVHAHVREALIRNVLLPHLDDGKMIVVA